MRRRGTLGHGLVVDLAVSGSLFGLNDLRGLFHPIHTQTLHFEMNACDLFIPICWICISHVSTKKAVYKTNIQSLKKQLHFTPPSLQDALTVHFIACELSLLG